MSLQNSSLKYQRSETLGCKDIRIRNQRFWERLNSFVPKIIILKFYCIQYTIYNILYTIYNILYTIYNLLFTIKNIQYTIYCIQYTVYNLHVHFTFNHHKSSHRIRKDQTGLCDACKKKIISLNLSLMINLKINSSRLKL